MKRSYLNLLTVGILSVSVVFAACQREFGEGGEQEGGQAGFEIAEAKQFFEQKYTELSSEIVTLQGFVKSMFDPGEFTPLWDKAREWGDGHTGYMAIPFIADYTYEGSFTVDPSAEKPERYMTTVFQRLLIGNGSGEMEGHIVSIVPSRDYYQRHGLSSGDRFAPVGSDFDGIVFYTSLNCVDIVRLEKYSRGKLMHSIDPNLSSQHPAKRYENIYKLAGQFGVSRSQKVGSRSGEYINGIGLTGFTSITPQGGWQTCVTSCMAGVNNYYGGTHTTQCYNDYYNNYYPHIPINEYGVLTKMVPSFVNELFYTVPFTSYSDAINAGYPVIALTEDAHHAVIIIGYGENGSLVCINPRSGQQSMMSESEITSDGSLHNFVITGNRI